MMSEVLNSPVLVLNRYFQPVQVTSARRAFCLMFGGTAQAIDGRGDAYDFDLWRQLPVEEGHDCIAIVGGSLRVPRVVHLHRYDRTPRLAVKLTRRNLMVRDGHQCQYCGKHLPSRDLNIDHVLPRCRGGQGSWENLVTSCKPCNLRKGWRTPDEANMHLLRKPFRPKWTLAAYILGEPLCFAEWEPFLKAG